MNQRTLRGLLALYPRAWRSRYGAEVASLTQELIGADETTPVRAGLNLVAGAATERGRSPSTWRTVLATAAAVAAVSGIALNMQRAVGNGENMRPYFENATAGTILLLAVMCWLMVEFVEFLRVSQEREWWASAVRFRSGGRVLAAAISLIAAEVWLYTAPSVLPGARIGDGAMAFGIGLGLFLAGVALRGWSFVALGRCFSYSIAVRPDQPVVSGGPYRVLRHPSYAGALLMLAGVGAMAANWVGLAVIVGVPLVPILWQIRVEERALTTVMGSRYEEYATRRQRLVPLVW